MDDKIYEIETLIGYGRKGAYFTLKNYPKLGVKIYTNNSLKEIKTEFKKGKIIRNLGISVPKYIGIIKIKISPEKINELNNSKFETFFQPSYYNPSLEMFYGLIIEYLDNDFELIESNYNSIVKSFYDEEREKIRNLKITPYDLCKEHILWNSRKQKFYIIDIESWIIPWKYYIKYMFI